MPFCLDSTIVIVDYLKVARWNTTMQWFHSFMWNVFSFIRNHHSKMELRHRLDNAMCGGDGGGVCVCVGGVINWIRRHSYNYHSHNYLTVEDTILLHCNCSQLLPQLPALHWRQNKPIKGLHSAVITGCLNAPGIKC